MTAVKNTIIKEGESGKRWQDKIFSQEIRDIRFLVVTYYNNDKHLLIKQLRHVI